MLVGLDSSLYLFAFVSAVAVIGLSFWQHRTRPTVLLNLMANERWYAGTALIYCAVLALELWLFCWNFNLVEFDAEAGSLLVSLMWLNGGEMYHGLNDPLRTALLYGPFTFIAYAIPLWVEPSLYFTRLTSAVALVVSFVMTNRLVISCGRDKPHHRRIQVWGLALAIPFGAVLYTSRADALLLLCMALATTVALKGRVVAAGIVAGIAIGLKASALLYVVPVVVLLKMRGTSLGRIGLGAFAASVTALLPFALPGISLGNYVDWLLEATRHGVQKDILLPNVLWLAAATLPMIGTIGRMDRAGKAVALAMCVCAALTAFMAGKVGAGAYHLVPYLPLYLWLLSQTGESKLHPVQMAHSVALLVAGPIVLLSFVLNSLFLLPLAGHRETKTSEAIYDDIRQIARTNPTRQLAIGYGELQHRQSNAALFVAMNGGRVLMTDVAMWDMHAAGRPLPESTLSALANCSGQLWLVPKGDTPFRSASLYRRNGPADLFGRAEAVFAANFEFTKSSGYFDVYRCAS